MNDDGGGGREEEEDAGAGPGAVLGRRVMGRDGSAERRLRPSESLFVVDCLAGAGGVGGGGGVCGSSSSSSSDSDETTKEGRCSREGARELRAEAETS